MSGSYDAIVVGLGVNGAAAALRLAERGARVLGLDRFAPPHPFGSSHGRTRIIREAYFEGEVYIPLVRRAYDAWRLLEAQHGVRLYRRTGGLTLAPDGAGIIADVRRVAEHHGVELEVLDGAEGRRRFPAFHCRDDDTVVYERNAGILFAERCVETLLRAAALAGAELRCGEMVRSWSPEGEGVKVRTSGGDVSAGRLVLAAGAWTGALLIGVAAPLEVERCVVHWFEPAGSVPPSSELPVFIEELEGGVLWYGIPEEGLLKAAFHHGGESSAPDALRREVDRRDVQRVRQLLRSLLPHAAGAYRGGVVCPYTNTPDGDFLLDLHPRHPQVVVASACSGHGFKFAPTTGELVASLALEGRDADVPAAFRWRW